MVPPRPASAGLPLLPSLLTMFLIGSGECIIGPMMALMAADFGVSPARMAWLPAAYALAFALLAIPLGPLSDHLGRKALLVPALAGFAVCLAALAFAPALWPQGAFGLALALAALAGGCAAAMQPNALALISDAIPDPARQGAALGRAFLGLTLSFIITPVIAGLLASRLDWRVPLLLLAGMAGLVTLLAASLPVPRQIRPNPVGLPVALAGLLAVPGAARRLATSFLWVGLSMGVLVLMVEMLRRRFGLGTEGASLVMGLFGLATLAGNAMVGAALRRAGPPERLVRIGMLASLAGVSALGLLPAPLLWLVLPALLLWALIYGAAAPLHHGLVAGLSETRRGLANAANASLLNLGIMSLTFSAGWLFDAAGPGAPMALAVCGILLALGLIWPRPAHPDSGQAATS